MKRWGIVAMAAAVLCVAGAALWFALGSGKKEGGPSVDLTPPALMPGTAGEISAWVFNGSVPVAAWERIISEFQKSTGFLVKLTAFESEEKYRQALRQAMADHALPDVFLIESGEAEALRQAGHLALLDMSPADAQTWVPGAMAPFRREDKTLAFPSDFSLLALYYNSALFDRLGVAYPDVHWTWDTLLSISQAVYTAADGDRKEPVYAMELPWGFDLWEAFARQAGGGLYDGSTWQAGDPKVVAPQLKALTFLRDYARNYVIVAKPLSLASGKAFLQGRAAMTIAGAELLHDLREQRNWRWGVAALPHDENRATVLKARGWAVSGLSARPRDAANLARALASQASRSDWLPAQLPRPGATPQEAEQVFYDSAAYAQPPPVIVTAPEMKKMIDEELLRWIGQKEPAPETMVDWAQKMFRE